MTPNATKLWKQRRISFIDTIEKGKYDGHERKNKEENEMESEDEKEGPGSKLNERERD